LEHVNCTDGLGVSEEGHASVKETILLVGGDSAVDEHTSNETNVLIELSEIIPIGKLVVDVVHLGLDEVGEEGIVVAGVETESIMYDFNSMDIVVVNFTIDDEVFNGNVDGGLHVHFEFTSKYVVSSFIGSIYLEIEEDIIIGTNNNTGGLVEFECFLRLG